MAVLLTALTSISTPFNWTPEAEITFTELKHQFVSAPVLIQPDTALQYIVAVDTGVGAVLSQRYQSDNKLHAGSFH